MKPFDMAAFSPAGTGTIADAFGTRHIIRITADQTGGSLGVFDVEVPPGEGPPPHVHEAEEEFFRVLSGRFAFWCNGTRVELDEGGVIVVPRGAVHTFRNIGTTPGRFMTLVTPGGFEGLFAAVAAAQPEAPEEIAALSARFHLRLVMDHSAPA